MNSLIEISNLLGSRFITHAQPMLVQSGILIALLLMADLLLRNRAHAGLRYALWMLVLVKLVLPPALALPTGIAYWLPGDAIAPVAAIVVSEAEPAVSADTPAGAGSEVGWPGLEARREPFSWQGILLLLWLSAGIVLAARVGWHFRSARNLVRRTLPAPASAIELLEECRRQLRIGQAVHLRTAQEPMSPAVLGIFRPTIIVSSELLRKLTPVELRSVFLHELAHVKRGDLWINHVQILLQVFYWYNPLVWIANVMIRRVREQAVDEMVLVEMKEEPEAYPATLVQVAKLALQRPGLRMGFVGILEPGSSLDQRIRHMIHHPVPRTARLGLRGAILITLVALLTLPMGRSIAVAANADLAANDVRAQVRSGRDLTADAIRNLETQLQAAPDDLAARYQLLGYYSRAQYRSQQARDARQKHVLWLIEQHPDSDAHTDAGRLDKVLDGAAYEKGKALWLQQVRDHPQSPAIRAHAASYCLINDRTIAEGLLKQGQELEPNSPKWAESLARLHTLNADHAGSGTRREEGKKALEQMELAQAQAKDETTRFYNLDALAKMALTAGDTEKAGAYAAQSLAKAEENKSNWHYGNAIHNGNAVLGRIALLDGKIEEAKKHLLAAGRTKGSPNLNSFGPNMTLAKELLEKGEKDAVLEYFKLCALFWKMGVDRLETWKAEVTEGKMPDFQANLVY